MSKPRRQLTLLDSTSIIVGVIIGAGIYESSPLIAANVTSASWLLGVWLVGGLISLIGALCYAELATAYPHAGGDYVYLTRALGRSPGFLFAWAHLWVDAPGSTGALAFVFARYANQLWPIETGAGEAAALTIYAAAAVAVLSTINILGVREGKWTQNALTGVKVLGLAAVIVVGLLYSVEDSGTQTEASLDQRAAATEPQAKPIAPAPSLGLALILVLFTYGGWKEMAYVAAEVRRPRKNILRALVLGTVSVTAIYLLFNLSLLGALGLGGMARSDAVAADVLSLAAGERGARLISLLICVSALGAMNGQIFAGARVYYAMGREHRLWHWLGRWHPRLGTPAAALALQGLITLGLVFAFGLLTSGGFQSMVEYTAPIYWMFFVLVGISLFVLRRREPDRPRPYRVWLYPITPLVFLASGLLLLYASLDYALRNASYEPLWAVALLAVGVIFSAVDRQ
ncbi:MAG: APC family permease [Pirellulales bacterium]